MGEGTAPKSEMQRSCREGSGDRSRLFCRAETATPAVAWRGCWGGDTQLWGQAGTGVPRAEAPLFSSAGPAGAARSLYTRWLRGCPPPSHPQEPRLLALARATSCICKFGGGGLGPPPDASSGPGDLSPTPTPGTGRDLGEWKGWRACPGGAKGKITLERHRDPKADTY